MIFNLLFNRKIVFLELNSELYTGIDRGPGPGEGRGTPFSRPPAPGNPRRLAGATPGPGETPGPGFRSYRATVISRDHRNIIIREMAQYFVFYGSRDDDRSLDTSFFAIFAMSPAPASKRRRGRGCRMDIADRVPGPGPGLDTRPRPENHPRSIAASN